MATPALNNKVVIQYNITSYSEVNRFDKVPFKQNNMGKPIEDEKGQLLPPNFSEQFRDLQGNVEYTKESIDKITISLREINSSIDSLENRINSKINLLETNINSKIDLLDSKIEKVISLLGNR